MELNQICEAPMIQHLEFLNAKGFSTLNIQGSKAMSIQGFQIGDLNIQPPGHEYSRPLVAAGRASKRTGVSRRLDSLRHPSFHEE